MAWLEMRDFWTLRPKEVLENKRHLFECKDSKSDTGHSLLVHLAASHAGIVNGNRRFYRPDRMQECVHTFLPKTTKDGTTLRTPRPVLVGHDEKGPVLGRVLEAKYVDSSWQYAHDFPVVKDFLFYQRDGRKRQTLFDSVDWVVDNLMPLEEYTGLGYTDLGIRITNPDAIRKVLADEYLSVSVGFRTDSAICSICKSDWAVDGKCEHTLGKSVDGKPQFLITGNFDYEEVSFINFAADPFATTVGEKVLKDSLEKIFFLGLSVHEQSNLQSAGMRMSDGLYESDLNATEELMDNVTSLDPVQIRDQIKSADLTKDLADKIRTNLAGWVPETDELKSEKRSLVSTLNAKIRKNHWDKVVTDSTDAAVAAELAQFVEDASKKPEVDPDEDADVDSEDDDLEDGMEAASNGQSGKKKVTKKGAKKTKEAQQKEIAGQEADLPFETGEDGCLLEGGDCNWAGYQFTDEETEFFSDIDGINSELDLELDAMVKEGEITADVAKDAKLSSEARGKLSGSSFCGPDRSFPVADCAHVTAARRLIGRAKVSDGTKAKILACVSRKAKKLGCGDAKKKDEAQVTKPDITSGADEQKFTERAGKFIEKALVQKDAATQPVELTQDERNDLVATVVALDKAYDRLAAKNAPRYALRWAVRAMISDWDTDEELRWALNSLKGGDQVVIPKSELDEKDEALNGLMTEKDALTKEIQTLKDSRVALVSNSKRVLAQQIVMHGVMTGNEAYKGLNTDQIESKIVELSTTRQITSLKDSVRDIISGLHWTPKTTDATSKTTESLKPMNDNARVTEEAPIGSNATDGVRSEAKNHAFDEGLQLRLRYMTQSERTLFLAKMSRDSAQTK